MGDLEWVDQINWAETSWRPVRGAAAPDWGAADHASGLQTNRNELEKRSKIAR